MAQNRTNGGLVSSMYEILNAYKYFRILLHFGNHSMCLTYLFINSLNLKENCFYHDVPFYGVNFPSDSPVITRATEGWEPWTERMFGRDGVLKGDVAMALKVGKEQLQV